MDAAMTRTHTYGGGPSGWASDCITGASCARFTAAARAANHSSVFTVTSKNQCSAHVHTPGSELIHHTRVNPYMWASVTTTITFTCKNPLFHRVLRHVSPGAFVPVETDYDGISVSGSARQENSKKFRSDLCVMARAAFKCMPSHNGD